MKRVIIVFAFLMWGATLCVWYVIHQEKNRYIVTNGVVLDLEKQRYIKVGKKSWEKLIETTDEQIEQFGEVVFEDHDYRFLKNYCWLSDDEWDYAVSAKGSGKEIFEKIKARRKRKLAEEKAYDEILSISIDDISTNNYLGYFKFAVDSGGESWVNILARLKSGEQAEDIAKDIKEAEPFYRRFR